VDCEDDRLPYPAGSGLASEEFHDKALPFIRMDVTSAAAVSTLSGFSQARRSHRTPAHPPHDRSAENLFAADALACF